jgi:hypothetical protein
LPAAFMQPWLTDTFINMKLQANILPTA